MTAVVAEGATWILDKSKMLIMPAAGAEAEFKPKIALNGTHWHRYQRIEKAPAMP